MDSLPDSGLKDGGPSARPVLGWALSGFGGEKDARRGSHVPARASHLLTTIERGALQKLRASGEMTLAAIGPFHRTVLKMIAKGWVERGSDGLTYRLTPDGD